MSDKTYAMTLLLDFYGELLTRKQRDYFEQYYNEDLSLAEIAENEGITRQGVRDLIVKAESALLRFEEKTGLIHRHLETMSRLESVKSGLRDIMELTGGEPREKAREALLALEELSPER